MILENRSGCGEIPREVKQCVRARGQVYRGVSGLYNLLY